MEIKYRWERNECYMLVEAGGISPDHYQLQMLENNRIDGLLKVQLQQINQQSEFRYTISGKQSMIRKYESGCISAEEIKKLMAALNKTAGQLEEFLLNIDSLRLEPEWIYWREDGDGLPEFCYYPEEVPEKNFREHVRTLLQYLLNKISHKDSDAVSAAYGLYQIGIKETFRMQDLMQFLFYGTEGNEEHGGEECSSSDLWEDGEQLFDDQYETADCEISDEGGRRKIQKQKQQKSKKQKERRKQSRVQEQKKGERRKQSRFADYVLALLVAALALAAVLRLAFIWYGRQGLMSEKEIIAYMGLVCAIIVMSGIAVYKLMVKSDGAAAVWEPPEVTADWEYNQEYNQRQEIFPDERSEATCVLNVFSSPPASGWRFCYQGAEESIQDFFLDGRESQVMVGKKLKAPDVGLNWPTVSRHHAVFQIRNGLCTVRDCGSTNGTYLDGDRLGREDIRVLLPGSQLKFADVAFLIEETKQDENETTVLTSL